MSPETVATEGAPHGPVEIVLVRHGESIGNIADRKAIAAKSHTLDLDISDEHVTLSAEGEEQARALARHIAELPAGEGPTVVVSSPYRRARQTAEIGLADAGLDVLLDERLRERELGTHDGLTWYGIQDRYPEESARRDRQGKFYYRPPGGESWADVVLRVRSILDELANRYDGERVWLFSHEAVILSFRYVLEGLEADRVLALQREEPIANASMTRYRNTAEGWELVREDDTSAVTEGGAPVTREDGHGTEEDA